MLCSCTQNKNATQKKSEAPSLSREERVNKIPYRGQMITDAEIDSIKNDVRQICSQYQNEIFSLNPLLIGLKKTDEGDFIQFDESWDDTHILKSYLNEAWRNKDFTGTAAIFYSTSMNAQIQSTKEILVIELEYEKYTGTWTAFFDLPLKDNFFISDFRLSYYDRN